MDKSRLVRRLPLTRVIERAVLDGSAIISGDEDAFESGAVLSDEMATSWSVTRAIFQRSFKSVGGGDRDQRYGFFVRHSFARFTDRYFCGSARIAKNEPHELYIWSA